MVIAHDPFLSFRRATSSIAGDHLSSTVGQGGTGAANGDESLQYIEVWSGVRTDDLGSGYRSDSQMGLGSMRMLSVASVKQHV
jgi:hypothetical protein